MERIFGNIKMRLSFSITLEIDNFHCDGFIHNWHRKLLDERSINKIYTDLKRKHSKVERKGYMIDALFMGAHRTVISESSQRKHSV